MVKVMDEGQVMFLSTENEDIIIHERLSKNPMFKIARNQKDMKEPILSSPSSKVEIPISFFEWVVSEAKRTGAEHLKLYVRTATPITVKFLSKDKMSETPDEDVETTVYCAPHIGDDMIDDETSESSKNKKLTNENAKLKKRLARLKELINADAEENKE